MPYNMNYGPYMANKGAWYLDPEDRNVLVLFRTAKRVHEKRDPNALKQHYAKILSGALHAITGGLFDLSTPRKVWNAAEAYRKAKDIDEDQWNLDDRRLLDDQHSENLVLMVMRINGLTIADFDDKDLATSFVETDLNDPTVSMDILTDNQHMHVLRMVPRVVRVLNQHYYNVAETSYAPGEPDPRPVWEEPELPYEFYREVDGLAERFDAQNGLL